jgi:hypothetical protein
LSFRRLCHLIEALLMKPSWLTPGMLRTFERIRGIGVAVLVLALIPWMAQDFISSLAATRMTARATYEGEERMLRFDNQGSLESDGLRRASNEGTLRAFCMLTVSQFSKSHIEIETEFLPLTS